MSDKASRVAEIEHNLKDITECSICTETFKDPKVLSCLHTFCKDCLHQLVTKLEKSAGEEVPCPICRNKFLIPVDGCDKLQKNFFMERLIEINGMIGQPSTTIHVCEACLHDEEQVHKKEAKTAEVYCSDCKQKLCKDCLKCHLMNKFCKNHKVFNLKEHPKMENSEADIAIKSEFCQKHSTKPLDLYCVDCREVACSFCFVEDHKNHEGSTVESLLNDFKTIMQQNVDGTLEFIPHLIEKYEKIKAYKSIMIEKYRDLEFGIYRRRAELRALIDTHTDILLSELNAKRDSYLQRMSHCSDNIRILISSLDSYVTYCREISTFGTDSSICKATESIKTRSTELRTLCGDEIKNVLESPALSLNPRLKHEDVKSSIENYIGEIAEPITQIYKATKRSWTEFNSVSKSYSDDTTVKGLTILSAEIFLAVRVNQNQSSKVIVEVYDSKTLWFKRKWEGTKQMDLMDMKSCESNRCLFILAAFEGSRRRTIIRFDSFGTVVSSWNVSPALTQLSVTDESNVFCVVGSNRFEEYTSDGLWLHTILLPSTYDSLSRMLAVKLDVDRFVVGYKVWGKLGMICIIDGSGKTLKSVTTMGDGEQLKWPFHLEKDRDNNVIVVDKNFNRLVVFDDNLFAISEPALLCKHLSDLRFRSKSGAFKGNMEKIIIDKSNGRVLVGRGGFGSPNILVINYC